MRRVDGSPQATGRRDHDRRRRERHGADHRPGSGPLGHMWGRKPRRTRRRLRRAPLELDLPGRTWRWFLRLELPCRQSTAEGKASNPFPSALHLRRTTAASYEAGLRQRAPWPAAVAPPTSLGRSLVELRDRPCAPALSARRGSIRFGEQGRKVLREGLAGSPRRGVARVSRGCRSDSERPERRRCRHCRAENSPFGCSHRFPPVISGCVATTCPSRVERHRVML